MWLCAQKDLLYCYPFCNSYCEALFLISFCVLSKKVNYVWTTSVETFRCNYFNIFSSEIQFASELTVFSLFKYWLKVAISSSCSLCLLFETILKLWKYIYHGSMEVYPACLGINILSKWSIKPLDQRLYTANKPLTSFWWS